MPKPKKFDSSERELTKQAKVILYAAQKNRERIKARARHVWKAI